MSLAFAPWWVIALAVLVAAIVVIVVFAGRSAKREPSSLDASGLLRFVGGLSVVFAFIVGLFTIVGVVAALADAGSAVDVPIEPYGPTLPAGVDVQGPTAVVTGGADHIEVSAVGLSVGTRVLIASGNLVAGAVFVVIALVVGHLARSALRDAAFRGTASRAIGAGAVVLALGSFVSGGLLQVAGWRAGQEVFAINSVSASGPAGDLISDSDGADLQIFGWPQPAFSVHFEFTPLLIALALGAIALIFREGERLRLRAEAAEADVKGLV
jgi:hypothetical protein